MKFWEKDSKLDRVSFWLIVVLFFLAKIPLMALLNKSGMQDIGWVLADAVWAIYLAMAVAARSRDAGWPGWIGASVMLFFTLVLPLGAILILMSYGKNMAGHYDLSNPIVSMTQQLYLLVCGAMILLYGCVPSKTAEPEPTA